MRLIEAAASSKDGSRVPAQKRRDAACRAAFKRTMAVFLTLVLMLGLSPFGASALAETPLGEAIFADIDDAGVPDDDAPGGELGEGASGVADEPESDDEDAPSGEEEAVEDDAVEDDASAAVTPSQPTVPEANNDANDADAVVPVAAAQPAALADDPTALSEDEPAAQAASLSVETRGTSGTAPISQGIGINANGQNGMVSMVGSYQFNATGNTNVRGKYTNEVGTAVHSSRVGILAGAAAGASADKALSGYDLPKIGAVAVGGKSTPGVGTGNYPAAGNNSSSAKLVRSSSNTKIVKAYLVIAATAAPAAQVTTTPLSSYGVTFMGPNEDKLYRLYPQVVYRDNGTAANAGARTRTSCFFDVTDIVQSQKDGGYGWYTVLNIPMTSMVDSNEANTGTDYFGSWRLVVIEEDTTLRPRMLRLKLGGTAVQSTDPAEVEISGEGLSVASNPTGQLIASMDGTDCDSGNSQNIKYETTGGTDSGKKTVSDTSGRNINDTHGIKYFRLLISNSGLLQNSLDYFDPAPINVNASGHSYAGAAIKATHNTDLVVQPVNDGNGGMILKGGENKVNMTVSTSSAPTILSVLGLTLDIVAPVFKTDLTISNLDQHYSTADEGYENKVNDRYTQTAREGDTLRATMVCENVSESKKFIGLEDPVVTLKVRSFKTINEKSITAFFYPGLYKEGGETRPESEGKIILDNVKVTYSDEEGCYVITASSNKLEKIQEKGYFEVTFTGEAKSSVSYVEYENYASVEGKYVDEQGGTHDDFHMANLGSTYTTTASDKPSYPLTVTAVGPGKVAGTAKYYSGDAAKISWEADSDAQVVAVFEDSSVRDDLVAQSNPAGRSLPAAQAARALAPQAELANSATVTMGSKAKEVIVVFKAKPDDSDPSDGPEGDDTQDDTFSVNAIADGGVEGMTDSGTVAKGSNYSVNWSVKPGYRITSIEVDGVAVPFDESTKSIDFSKIGANHTVKVLTQRVATDGSDGTWMVSTTISGPGTISPTTVVKAGSSYKVSWAPQAGSTDAVLSLVKVDGKVVYDEYLNNPKTETDNASNAGVSSYDFTNITGNHSVEVVYRGTSADNTYSKDYVVDTKISGGLGEISPSVTVPESSTSNVSVTVTPKDGSTVEALYLQRGSVKQLLENGKDGVVIATDADGKVTVTLPRDLIDSDYTVEAVLSSPGSSGGPGTNPSTTYTITTSIAGGSGGKITATQIGIGAGENRTITWQSDSDRHVTAVMVDGKMRDDLLNAGKVDFSNIRGDHNVVVYVSEKESSNPGGNPGDKPVNPDNPDGHDPTVPDPTDPGKPGTPGNPGGIPAEKGDEKYLYVNVVTVGPGDASPSVSVREGGFAEVSWAAAKGYKVKSVTVDGIERLDLMRDLAKGELSFEKIQRDHNVVITFEADPDHVPDPTDPNDPDPRPVIDPEQPDSYSLITTEILGGAGTITGNSYNQPGSSRVITWAPAEGYYVKAVYVDGKEVPLTEGMTSYEFTALEGGKHHSVEVRMAPLVPDPDDEPQKPEVIIDKPINIPPVPGGKVTPEDILDIVEKELGDELPEGTPEVIITTDGKTVDEIDQSVPGTYVIELVYTDEDGNQKVVRLTYMVKGAASGSAGEKGDAASPDRLLPRTGDDLGGTAWGLGATAAVAAVVALAARRKLGQL